MITLRRFSVRSSPALSQVSDPAVSHLACAQLHFYHGRINRANNPAAIRYLFREYSAKLERL